MLTGAIMAYHFWKVRKNGGISQPERKETDRIERRTTIPHLVQKEVAVALFVITGVLVWAMLNPSPLGELANPFNSPNPAKAAWYFMGLQELLLHMHPLAALIMVGLGLLALAIYNDEQYVSRAWTGIKKIYQRLPGALRVPYVLVIWCMLFVKRLAVTIAATILRLLTLRNPFAPILNWITETRSRGMNSWYDLVDWVGGWPFEVARPEDVFRFFRDRGFTLTELTTSGGHGCNEFVFQKDLKRPRYH